MTTDNETRTQMADQMQISQILQGQNALSELNSSLAKWLYGSLLAINVGGLTSLSSNFENYQASLARFSAVCFLIGCLFAVALGHNQLTRAELAATYLSKISEFFMSALRSQSTETIGIELGNLKTRLDNGRIWPRLLGWCSAFCFSVGVLTLIGFECNG